MENMVKVRVYNIGYEILNINWKENNRRTEIYLEDNDMTWKEFEQYRDELEDDIILEIDPEHINWTMDDIPEYIVDYISEEIGEGFVGYKYEVLVGIREVKLNLLGI
jgi:hypothetical protein